MITLPADLTPDKLPKHVAIIMDGNGRWARARGLRRSQGHSKGAERVRPLVDFCKEIGVPYITLYAFSSENWKRSALERNFLWRLLVQFLRKERPDMMLKGVRFKAIGDFLELPRFAREEIAKTIEMTKDNKAVTLCLALNYGSRNEITRAIRSIAEDCANGKLDVQNISEELISGRLDTAGMPDPDLIIRTAGEMRLSNYLLWQASYAEFHSTEARWPDFDEMEFVRALEVYAKRVRRLGGVPQNEDNL